MTPEQQGYKAYHRNECFVLDNPFPTDTSMHTEWQDGWEQAEIDYERWLEKAE